MRDLTDEELLTRCRSGEEQAYEALAERYKSIVRREAAAFFPAGGGDRADLIQEGMIGLYQAVMRYDAAKGASFGSFALLVIRRRIMNAVSAASRRRHEPLNDYIPLGGGQDGETVDPAADEVDTNPERIALDKEATEETYRLRRKFAQELSPFEREVFKMMQEGETLSGMAGRLGRSKKQVDNARTRIRRKWDAFRPGGA